MHLPAHFVVVPCQGKIPLIKWTPFIDRAPTAEEKAGWKLDGDVGIICGPVSRLFVLDIDGPEGEASLAKYNLPKTWRVKTPHGTHYYFKWISALDNKITTKAGVLNGVDVRGAGGFVRFYGWAIPPHLAVLQSPPQWLIDLLPNKEVRPSLTSEDTSITGGDVGSNPTEGSVSKFQATLDKMKEGNRNESFFKLAAGLRARNYKPEEIFELLRPKAKEVAFPESELRIVCGSAGKYAPDVRHVVDETNNSLSDFLADAKETPYIVPGLIAENTINILAGLQESRKSWILLDLAVAIAAGGNWLMKHPCQKKRVLIIDQERPKLEMQRRIKALLAGRGMAFSELEGNLIPKAGTTMRMNLEQSYEKFCRMIETVKPEVVLIDSLKTFQSGVITDNQEMQLVFERFKELRLKYGITFVILHHENKGAYARSRDGLEVTAENIAGASSINEVPEGIFVSVNHDSETSMLHHVKNSYGRKQAPFLVRVNDLNEEKTSIRVEAF